MWLWQINSNVRIIIKRNNHDLYDRFNLMIDFFDCKMNF
jgi:hypothetical protein